MVDAYAPARQDDGAVVVTVARPDDVEVVRELRLAALANAPDAFWRTYAEEVDRPLGWWRERVRTAKRWLIATHHGHPSGLAAMETGHGGREDRPHLVSLWVAPSVRGCGVADALVRTVLEVAHAEGAAVVTLEVGDTNAPAIALYRRHGFRPTGRTGRFLPPREHITEHELIRTL